MISKLIKILVPLLLWTIIIALGWAILVQANAQMPPSYYGLPQGAPLTPVSPENAVEPPPGQLVVADPPPSPPLPPPPPPLVTYYVIPSPELDFVVGDLSLPPPPVILIRTCWHEHYWAHGKWQYRSAHTKCSVPE